MMDLLHVTGNGGGIIRGNNNNNSINEIINLEYEKNFLKIVIEELLEILQISYTERRIVSALLSTALENKISHRNGLLEQYLHAQLDILANTFKSKFDLDKSIKVNYNYATHAKFEDIITAIKEKEGNYK